MNRIAEDMGWCAQTITDELRNRRVDSDKRYGCSNRLCAHYEECRLESYTATGKGLRKNQPKCFETCPNFREEVCHRLARPPFICNGCAKEHNCPMRKKYYIPEAAQANYEGTLRNSRTGIHPDEKKVKAMNEVLSPALKKGQSATAIVRSNPETFKGVARSTLYGYIRDGLFTAKGSDMPFAGKSKRPHRKPEIKTTAKCRVGRTIREMREWLKEHAGVVPCELDTVIGSISGKVLFTMIFPDTGLALAFLREEKTARVDRPEQDGIRAVRDDPTRVLVAVYFREEHRELVVREDVWREPIALWRACGGELVRRTARCVDEPCQEAEERGLL